MKSKSATLVSPEACLKQLVRASIRRAAEIKWLRAAGKETHGKHKKPSEVTSHDNCRKIDHEGKIKNDICLCMLDRDGIEPQKLV